MDTKINSLSNEARAVAKRISSLRDFLEFLSEHDQCITWPDRVLPEPDIRNVVVAAGRGYERPSDHLRQDCWLS